MSLNLRQDSRPGGFLDIFHGRRVEDATGSRKNGSLGGGHPMRAQQRGRPSSSAKRQERRPFKRWPPFNPSRPNVVNPNGVLLPRKYAFCFVRKKKEKETTEKGGEENQKLLSRERDKLQERAVSASKESRCCLSEREGGYSFRRKELRPFPDRRLSKRLGQRSAAQWRY